MSAFDLMVKCQQIVILKLLTYSFHKYQAIDEISVFVAHLTKKNIYQIQYSFAEMVEGRSGVNTGGAPTGNPSPASSTSTARTTRLINGTKSFGG